jgi:hypothetical protein
MASIANKQGVVNPISGFYEKSVKKWQKSRQNAALHRRRLLTDMGFSGEVF